MLQQRTDAAKAAAESVAMEVESESEGEEEEEGEDRGRAEDEFQQKLSFKDNTGNNRNMGRDLHMKNVYEVTQPMPAAPQVSNVVIREYDPKKKG